MQTRDEEKQGRMIQSRWSHIQQPSDLPDRYVVFTGGLCEEQAASRSIPLRVVEVRPAPTAAGKPGHAVFCEDSRGDIIRFTFGKLKQNAIIVEDLEEWLTEGIQRRGMQEFQVVLAIREKINKEQVERLPQTTAEDIEPEWMGLVRKALPRREQG